MRSPRHHVWSLFSECKYSPWGLRRTRNLAFPSSGNTSQSDEIDFDMWLDRFVPVGPEGGDYYNCYHPANFQSRALASRAHGPRGVEEDPVKPDVNLATETYWNFDFVALVEFFHESQCLFYYRLGSSAPARATSYLEYNCQCHHRVEKDNTEHVTHHELGHRSVLRDLPPYTLSKVEELTEIDTKIYITALWEFMVEIAWLESESALGRRVLCNSSLKKMESELAYLHFNVSEVYSAAAQKGSKTRGSNI